MRKQMKVTHNQNTEMTCNLFIKKEKKIEKATMNEQLQNRPVKTKDVAQDMLQEIIKNAKCNRSERSFATPRTK